MNRRTFASIAPVFPVANNLQTPTAVTGNSGPHAFNDLRESAMYFRSCRYDVAMDLDGPVFTVHSWACGFLAHPASRSTYRQYPNLFEAGPTEFIMPGLPAMSGELIERSEEIFGEDASLISLASDNSQDSSGAMAICLNGAMVQMICIEPASDLSQEDAGSFIRKMAESVQARDPEFYGRGDMNREIVNSHTVTPDDIRLVFPRLRICEDSYVLRQSDGISDFWE